jgi:enoyl-CoA hydratase/carnithine racemase
MAYEEIIYEVSDGIATITLNRPDKLNAWTLKMEGEYRHAMAEAEKDAAARVIVVTGAGRGFCAGADMSLLQSVANQELDDADITAPHASPGADNGAHADFLKQYSFPLAVNKPILAAINGAAVGIGFVHALYCDIRFASDKAKFSTIFAQRGLVAEHGSAWMLPRIVGLENALDLFYSGRMVDANEAKSLGLVSRVVPHDDLMVTVREYALNLAKNSSPRAMAEMKREVYSAQVTDFAVAYDAAVNDMMASFSTEDFREGVMSFLEKRPAQFSGK